MSISQQQKSPSKHLFLGAIFAIALYYGLPPALANENPSAQYVACTVQSRSNPSKALEIADKWLSESKDNGAALHCRALALYALQRFEEAAKALDTLSGVLTQDQTSLKLNVLSQAAYAYQLSDNSPKAIDMLTDALSISTNSPTNQEVTAKLLRQRAELYRTTNALHKSMQDLDHLLSLTPSNAEALLARANLYREMDRADLAKDDYDQVLAIQPGNVEARKALLDLTAPPPSK